MGLDTIAAVIFAVVLISLSAAISAVIGGRANGISLRPPKWLVRFILGERNNPAIPR
jgi:hypothetical protein